MPSISCIDLSYEHPDRTAVFDSLNFSLGAGLSSLVGANGAGKSTLLRLLAGRLAPSSGTVKVDGAVAYVPQDLLDTGTLGGLLGVSEQLEALARIEAGSTDPADFTVLGDAWDVWERTSAVIETMELPQGLDRPAAQLSGGERTLAAVAGALLARADVLLLDEPTNNLDTRARERLFAALADFVGGGRCALVVSHDLELLEQAGTTCELHDGAVRVFAGPYSAMREALDGEQAAAAKAATSARDDLRAAKRQRKQASQMNATRARIAKKAEREKRVPKIAAGLRRDAAEKAAGKLTDRHAEKVAGAASAAQAADDAVRRVRLLRIDLPDPGLPRTREVISGRDAGLDSGLHVLGPERVRLTGPNGSGKTTFLRSLVNGSGTMADDAIAVPYAYLAQDLPVLPADRDTTVVAFIAGGRPDAEPSDSHAHAARFLFTGDSGAKRLGELSGGERLRVYLAKALFAQPVPELLVLDEPTNNLDISGVEQLAGALASWRGALLLVTHDAGFAERVGIDREVAVLG